MGLETLKSRRDKAKLKWWYKLATMPQDRYPKQLFSQEWNVKPRRGRQRKTWGKVIDDIFLSLGLDKCEWLEDIEREDSSLAAFMSCVEECISERECRKFEEGLNNKVKLAMYKTFGKNVEFKKYLHGVSDAGTRLLFKFRSGTHGLNEELGRHRGREGKLECALCGAECESVVHVLWECSAYSSSRASFLLKLEELLGDRYADFEALNSVEKTSYVLGSELWEQNFKSLLRLVKEFIVNVWEVRKQKLYGDDSCPNQLQSQSSPGGLGGVTGVEGKRGGKFRDGKFREGKLYCVCYASVAVCNVCVDACACTCGCKCKCDNVHSCMDTCTCMCSSAHSCGCVADGGDAMAAF